MNTVFRLAVGAALVAGLSLVVAAPAAASPMQAPGISADWRAERAHPRRQGHRLGKRFDFRKLASRNVGRWGRGVGAGVPELDPGVAGQALVLMIGGALVLADRRRRVAVRS